MLKFKNCLIRDSFGAVVLSINDLTLNKSEAIQIIGNNNSGKSQFCNFIITNKDNGFDDSFIFESENPTIVKIDITDNLLENYNLLENILIPFKRKSENLKNKKDLMLCIYYSITFMF